MKKKTTIIIIGIVILLIISLFILKIATTKDSTKSNSSELKTYIKELINLDLKDYVEYEDGNKGSYANIAFKLKDGSKEDIDKMLTEVCGTEIPLDNYVIPGFMGHRLASQMKSQKIVSVHTVFKTVDTEDGMQTTRDIHVILTMDNDSAYWLYIFG